MERKIGRGLNEMIELQKMRRMVVKVGTSTLTHSTGKLNLGQLERLVREFADIRNRGIEVILVSSGAVGAGMGRLGLKKKPQNIPEKQALAAVGQGILMQMYEKLFAEYGEVVAQILLTREDINQRDRYLNARNTLLTLLKLGVIPIINENDTVAFEEIKFGDNDTLAALVAGLVDADLLVLLTDIDGLYTADPRKDQTAQLLKEVHELAPEIMNLAGEAGSALGSGGMLTKIQAAEIIGNSGIPMIVANGMRQGVLKEIVMGENPGTLFLPSEHRLNSRKAWIGYASKACGAVYVDEGAEKALLEMGKSLLPSGIIDVEDDFERGSVVSVRGKSGEIARGIVNYGAAEIRKIMGRQSKEISKILGYKDFDEVIHRDNLTLRK